MNVLDKIVIDEVNINTFSIELPYAKLILAAAPKGFVMCGYLDISVAEKLNDVACVVSGVASVEELLAKPIVKLTPRAEQMGISLGISGREALEIMVK
ncbi:MAG: YunC family protein [PVC group bacterium]|nr:YunC family protein [PVC group bacterium]